MRISIILNMRGALPGIIAVATLAAACGTSPTAMTARSTKPIVVTTTTQTADFVRVIAGDTVVVYDIIRPGVDPHDYEPTAADLHAMTQATVIVTNGLGLEPWLARATKATNRSARIVTTSDGVVLRPNDPHIWQSPLNAKIMVGTIAAALAKAMPAQTDTFAANLASYDRQLDALDTDIAHDLAGLTSARLVTNHDSFGYLVDRYGLEFVGSILPSFDSSAELSPADIRALVRKIKAQHVKAVFSEASLPPKTAQAVAAEAGVRIVMGNHALYGDSLGPLGSDADTYLKMMRHNVQTLMAELS
jgi:zinc/manganese transport system substrate-binding protein